LERTPVEREHPTATATATLDPFDVQLAWFYKPPSNDLLNVLSEGFDFFILTHKDEEIRDELRSLGVDGAIPQYLLLTEIRDPGDCTELPFGNQVAFHKGDFCMIDSEHPDWFLLDQKGRRIGGDEVYFMDPGNPEFRAFWLTRAREMQEQYGWTGIFIDNVDAGLGRFRNRQVTPKSYKTDDEYRDAVKGFLEYLQINYFQPTGRKMYVNVTSTQDYDVWLQYLDFVDGVMVENFAAGWPGRNKSRTEWEEQMNALEKAYKQNKVTILVSQGEQDDVRRQEFSFASYLLIANDLSYFRYALSGNYDEVWFYENYNIDLGPAISDRYRMGATWRRDFLYGYVTVNPGTLRAKIVSR